MTHPFPLASSSRTKTKPQRLAKNPGPTVNDTAPNSRVQWRGVWLDARTRAALRWAEKKSGVSITPTQGSFSTAVAASGSTHAGASAVDIRTRDLTVEQRKRLVRALKLAGFAAWYRSERHGFAPHIHAILIGGGPQGIDSVGGNRLSSGAAWQIRQFDQGRNGLTNSQPDNTFRPSKRRFSYRQGRPVSR